MKIVIFGLTISSSWGNGHATLWRALCRALAARGHRVTFFERDVAYYALNRDLRELPGLDLRMYEDWEEARARAARDCQDADVAMVTSYCPDGIAATGVVADSSARLKIFYDMDTPITLGSLEQGRPVSYIGERGLGDFDLVLSFTGGAALNLLQDRLGARRVATLYGSVDPDVHHPAEPVPNYRSDLSYIGTYAEDRQDTLERLFVEPARAMPERRFVIGGAQYPVNFPWAPNIFFVRHLPPGEHAAFFSSGRATLNVTRRAMAEMGYCPSGRLFEAAACGALIVTDAWEGLDHFFEPGEEVLVASESSDVVEAMAMADGERGRIARRARERVLDEYTAAHRAEEFERLCSEAANDHGIMAAGKAQGGMG